ncbi:MAG: pyridoxamine 5'-phosphate oxidase family protein [Bacilli bacterium]|nr:pyridoxamine 5'-phosphate oxidase family protein [Bacilli bacterium]
MRKELEEIVNFLDEAKTYYLATVDGDKPRVRPFGTALVYEDKLYIQTGKVKDVSKQISKNHNVEICAFLNGKWLRLSGKLVNDDRREVKKAMLDKMPVLRGMYSEDDDNTQVLYFTDATAKFCSFGGENKEYHF